MAIVRNLATVKTTADITSSATSIPVNRVDVFGTSQTTLDNPFYVTIMPASGDEPANSANSEIVLVTGVSGLNLTVTRGQRSTTAKAFSSGSIVTMGIYAEDAVLLGDEGTAVGTPAPWVESSDIKNGAIATDKIANVAVTSAKIDWATIGKSSNHYIKFGDIVIQWGVADFGNQSFSTDFWATFNRAANQDMHFNYPIAFDEKPVLMMNVVDSNIPLLGICYAANNGSGSRSPSFTVYVPKGFTSTANVKIQWIAIGVKK